MSCIECDLLLIVDLEFVPCLVSPGVAESFWFSRCPAAASSESGSTESP